MKAPPVIGAINRHLLAGPQRDRTPQKCIDRADFGVHFSQTIRSVVLDRDVAISVAPQQLVHKIGDCDPAVARELNAPQDVHWAATGLRPQSLATQ